MYKIEQVLKFLYLDTVVSDEGKCEGKINFHLVSLALLEDRSTEDFWYFTAVICYFCNLIDHEIAQC